MSDDHHQHGNHIVPLSIYYAVFATLLVMTGVTVGIAYVDLGAANIYVALGIAAFKATVVVLYFMHVKYSSPLVQLSAAAGFIWLAIMLSFTSTDYVTRDYVGASDGWAMQPIDAGTLHHGDTHHGGEGNEEEASGEH